MHVTLKGSSPAATTAGIMLLTRARQLGDRLSVAILGDPTDRVVVPGPVVCYAPVLAGCGVGREYGSGATIVVPGPPTEPLMVSVHPHGQSGWFYVDRLGKGAHPASQAFVRLSVDERPAARQLGRTMRSAMSALGLSTDPATLDVLFGADVPPLTRLAVGLRAGRALTGGRGEPITRFTRGMVDADPLDGLFDDAMAEKMMEEGSLHWILDGLSTSIRDQAEECIALARQLAAEDAGRDLSLLHAIAELASQLIQLPSHSILPPLGAAEDSVATSLGRALTAFGDGDANAQMGQVFRFLGGTYVASADHVVEVSNEAPPSDRISLWTWFSDEARRGRKQADALWPDLIDPPS